MSAGFSVHIAVKLSDLPLVYFITPNQRLFWGYLLTSAIIALFVLWYPNGRTEKPLRFDKQYWLHQSAKIDYGYFFIIWLFKFFLIAPLLFSAHSVAITTYRFARDYIEPIYGMSYETVGLLYTIALFVCSDFTRYWLHRALHQFDFLWAFHKVHHSAKVLNPVTFYRIHPVESLLFGIRYSLTAGVVTGLFMTWFGAKLHINQILGTNLFLFIFSTVGSNLRHSHIYWRFPEWLEQFFISPAQHQLHHQYCYSRHNYGGYLAIWDTLFGTLKTSQDTTKPKQFGIATNEMQDFNRINKLLITPFIQVTQQIRGQNHKPIHHHNIKTKPTVTQQNE